MIDERDLEVIHFRRRELIERQSLTTAERLEAEHPEWDAERRTTALRAAMVEAGFTAEELSPTYYSSPAFFAAIRGGQKVAAADARRINGVARLKGREE